MKKTLIAGAVCACVFVAPAWAQNNGLSGAAKSAAAAPPLVVDAKGNAIGRYIYAGGSTWPYGGTNFAGPAVLYYYRGDFVILPLVEALSGTGYGWTSTGRVFFTSTDCSGAAYLMLGVSMVGTRLISSTHADPSTQNATTYVATASNPVNLAMNSYLDSNQSGSVSGNTCQPNGSALPMPVYPVTDTIDHAVLGTYPYYVK